MPGDYLWFSASKSCPVLSPRLKYHETWIQRWSTHKTEHFGVRRRCFICVRSRSYTLRHGEAVAFLFLDRLPFDINVLQIRLLYFGEQVRRKIKVNDREKQVRGGKRERTGLGKGERMGERKKWKADISYCLLVLLIVAIALVSVRQRCFFWSRLQSVIECNQCKAAAYMNGGSGRVKLDIIQRSRIPVSMSWLSLVCSCRTANTIRHDEKRRWIRRGGDTENRQPVSSVYCCRNDSWRKN